jgi:predicted Zn-dependent protease
MAGPCDSGLRALSRAVSLQPLEGRYKMLLCRAVADQALSGEAPASDVFATRERAIATEPANPYFYTAAVNAAVQVGDLRQPRRLVAAGLKLYPTLGPLRYQLGFVALQEARLDEAARELSGGDREFSDSGGFADERDHDPREAVVASKGRPPGCVRVGVQGLHIRRFQLNRSA